jgi:heptosyltransferase I
MTLSRSITPEKPPASICILRLSALGDITHALPVLRTLQKHWPETSITWIIGKTEYELVRDIGGVEFIIFDKSRGLGAYSDLRRQMKGRRFDILLHMQLSLRASAASLFIPARIKLGFDRERAKDLQWLFSNQKITPASTRQHVVDSFIEFPKHIGLEPVMEWQLPVSREAKASLLQKLSSNAAELNTEGPLLVISPCAMAKSRNWRDWTAEGYASVADYAATELNMAVVISGGPSVREKAITDKILSLCKTNPVDLVGKTSIAELVALLDLASIVIAPDTGPAHVASALGTPVIGLYAATNPQRAAPYNSQQYVVNKYPQALDAYYSLSVDEAPWGKRIQNSECMAMISPDDVTEKLEVILNMIQHV